MEKFEDIQLKKKISIQYANYEKKNYYENFNI